MPAQYNIARRSKDGKRVQLTPEHNANMIDLACRMTKDLHNEQLRLAVILNILTHDVGKHSESFDKRVHGGTEKCDHSTAGGYECFKHGQHMVGMTAMGHHSGIPNLGGRGDVGTGSYYSRINKAKAGGIPDYSGYEKVIPIDWKKYECLKTPMPDFPRMMLMRMSESVLVDADRLDAASFEYQQPVTFSELKPQEMIERLEKYKTILKKYTQGNPMNKERDRVWKECVTQGQNTNEGVYILDAPTGFGKTMAAIAFALYHAQRNNKKHIFYGAPYLSIIDGTAVVMEDAFGRKNVLEHHSLAEVNEELSMWAGDNWDAPFVVTSTNQIVETWFSNSAGKLRKLHNMANSVIILDELQSIPQWALEPVCAAIHELVEVFHSTILICTATPPKIERYLKKYAAQKNVPTIPVKTLCGNYDRSAFQRVRVEMLNPYWEHGRKRMKKIDNHDLAQLLAAKHQALCVVNTVKGCRELSEELEKCSNGNLDGIYLSTDLFSQDRKARIREIRDRLMTGKRCVVIATSLIEAGIDVDFPFVFREMTGIDSIIQAAGRCNRNGMIPGGGVLYLFVSSYKLPESMRMNPIIGWHTLDQNPNLDILSPEMCVAYFEQRDKELTPADGNPIMNLIARKPLPFADVGEMFRLIKEDTKTVALSVGGGKKLIDRLIAGERTKHLYNEIQSYSVNLYPNEYAALKPHITEIGGMKVILDASLYDPKYGLRV